MNTLLVVEDEKLIRQGIVAMIRRSSVPVEEILECRNGEEALEILRKQRVDVMFTDIRMPKMDGLTLVNKMEELSQKPVVIVLSGYDEFSYAVEMMKHGVRDYILKPIKRETIEQLLENLERELSETRETEEEEERCFLNQLRYLMMNAEMAEEKEWMDMESRIRRHIGNDSFRILLTSKANGERFSKCSGILLEGVEGGVLYLLPEPEAERIMKEKDERFCLGVGKEHRSVMEIPEAYQEALLAREMAFIQKNPVEEYQKKCFEEKPELAQFQEKFILQVPTDRADTVLRKMRNWYFEAAHQRVSPYQLLTVTEAICKELGLKAVKYANLDASDINRKDPATIISKMAGGFLLIERASFMTPETIEKLSQAMDFRTDSMILLIEDDKANMRKMLADYPEFAEKFENVISIPVFTNDELVTFARTYARENGFRMDEMGVLALYTMIGDNQKEDEPITIGKVKEMVDGAIRKASGVKLGRKLSKRHTDADGRILLYEKDFDL